jgi:putative AlgH/UPF0301 family transcriptional regulator
MVVVVSPSTQRTVVKRLYRSLLRASRPFTPPSPNAVVLTCLLHRTGTEDASWADFLRGNRDRQQSSATELSAAASSAAAEEEESESSMTEEATEDDDEEESDAFDTGDSDDEYDMDDIETDDDDDPGHVMFRKLLREAVNSTGEPKGIRQMQFPSHVVTDPYRIRNIIRREFRRRDDLDIDNDDDDAKKLLAVKKQVAFLALRKLNEKLAYAQHLEQTAGSLIFSNDQHPSATAAAARQQGRRRPVSVSPLPLRPPKSYLRPGSFLIAHPNLNGYFRRAVICILAHHEEDTEGVRVKMQDDEVLDPALARRMVGTYGLVVNRTTTAGGHHTGKQHLTLQDSLRPLPEQLSKAFGASPVRNGGPVQVSLQMLHCLSADLQEELQIGGHVLPMIPSSSLDDDDDDTIVESTALQSDRAVLFQGDILKAATAVSSGRLDPKNDVSFFVGASSWSLGQLEFEVECGIWLPCRAPPEIAMYGSTYYCDEYYRNGKKVEENKDDDSSNNSTARNGMEAKEESEKRDRRRKGKDDDDDLWLCLFSACGKDEAKLAHLLWSHDGFHAYGSAMDKFD